MGLVAGGSNLYGALWFLFWQPKRKLRKYAIPFALLAVAAGLILIGSYHGQILGNFGLYDLYIGVAAANVGTAVLLILYWGRGKRQERDDRPTQRF